MKILLIQLARFGDIFQTWPSVRALRRSNPHAEIHILVRERFAAGIDGLKEVNKVWALPTRRILEGVLLTEGGESESLRELNSFVDQLAAEQFTDIVNLSFSPFSSYLTAEIRGPNCDVRGYTRHSDGYLAIPDDASAYFYAQVGLGKENRFHLSDIFSNVCGVDLIESDWASPPLPDLKLNLQSPYFVVHLGSSQSHKNYPAFKWRAALGRILNQFPGAIYLIGSKDEQPLADEVLLGAEFNRVQSLIGMTDVPQLFTLLAGAQLLVGADSAPMHIASMVGCPCLNLSLGGVNFWETGPRSAGSRILVAESGDTLPSDRVAEEIISLWQGTESRFPILVRDAGRPEGYRWLNRLDEDWMWKFLKGLYCGEELPTLSDEITISGMMRLREMTTVCLEQFPNLLHQSKRKAANRIIEQSDAVFEAIGKFAPRVRPLLNWFFTERLRKGPAPLDELIEFNQNIYQQLKYVLDLYLGKEESATV